MGEQVEEGGDEKLRDLTRSLVRAERTARFLAEASASLAELTDYESTLQTIAGLAVPRFADWCAVELIDADGAIKRLATTHADPVKLERLRELNAKYLPGPGHDHGIQEVIRRDGPDWIPEITPEWIAARPWSDEQRRLVERLGPRSYICVPMRSQGRIFGALTFVTSDSGRLFDEHDLQAAVDLANRAAIAIENARLVLALRQADRRKDEWVATLAHELRNPLATLRNGLQYLKLAGQLTPPGEQARGMMERQLGHVVRLVDDLMDVNRIALNKLVLKKQKAELAGILNGAVELARPLIETKEHVLEIALPPRAVLVEGDVARLTQIFSNLLSNAAKYSEPGGRIRIEAALEGKQAVVRVRDRGIGIPPKLLPVIFELFTQVDSSIERTQGGLGIGLTLVKRLTELHGGTVEARSDGPGTGSEFTVRLPGCD